MRKSILFFVFIFSLISFASAVEISAKSAVLIDASSNTVLFEKNMHTKAPMASTTKIMTCIVVLENSEPDEKVVVLPEYTGVEGTSIYLKQNEVITVDALLHGLMLNSGNDAAVALSGHVAGDLENFVGLMNEKAKELGMKNTQFTNPHGLPDDGHYSTAYDMAILSAYAMKNPKFCEIVSKKSYKRDGRVFSNHNKLLSLYEPCTGIKTGYTKKAGRCLVSSASKDGLDLVAVTLSAPDDWDDHTRLFECAFDNYVMNTCAKKNEAVSDLHVVGGVVDKTVAVAKNDVNFLCKKTDNLVFEINLPRFIYAPVEKNQKIGEIRIIKNGEEIGKCDLVSNVQIREQKELSLWDKILKFLKKAMF